MTSRSRTSFPINSGRVQHLKTWHEHKIYTIPGREVGGEVTQGGFWAAHHELKNLILGPSTRATQRRAQKPSLRVAPQAQRGDLAAHPIPPPEVPVCRDLTNFVF